MLVARIFPLQSQNSNPNAAALCRNRLVLFLAQHRRACALVTRSVGRGFLSLLPLVWYLATQRNVPARVTFFHPVTTWAKMSPPTYNDLGKSARDVFGQGYHFGLFKLDVKTKTHSDVEFSCGGVSNQDTGKVFGNLETKYKFKEHGLTFSEKWNTDNTLGTEITIANKLLNGLTVGYSCTFSPQTGSKTGKLKTTYKHENVSATADFDLSLSAGPLIYASAVVGYQGWLGGYQASFDTQRNKLTRNNFALGFTASDFTLHSAVDNGREFNSSIYHKIKPDLEGAINLAYNSGNNVTQFGIGAKYNLDNDASIRAKVNSNLQIGLGYQQKLRDGVTLTLSTNIDGKNFGSGGHKYGVALDLQA